MLNLVDDLFCAGHAWDRNGDWIVGGGTMSYPYCNPEPNWAYLFRVTLVIPQWTKLSDMLAPTLPNPALPIPPNPATYGHYYPSLISLPESDSEAGWVLSLGGTTTPDQGNCIPRALFRSNEFQIFDGATWRGKDLVTPYDGLAEAPVAADPTFEVDGFRFYPSMHVLHSGYVFVSNAEQAGRDTNPSPAYNWSASALLGYRPLSTAPLQPLSDAPLVPGTWEWVPQNPAARPRNFVLPTPPPPSDTVNLTFPTGVLHPYTVDVSGGVSEDRVILIGGHDRHQFLPFSPPAVDQVWEIQDPHLSHLDPPLSVWTPFGGDDDAPGSRMNHPRVYANAVLTPDLGMIVFGGSAIEFRPFDFASQIPPSPVYTPERFDFLNPTADWDEMTDQASPRLYHSVTVLLKDGRIASMGGYTKDVSELTNHSDVEIFTPPYLQTDIGRPVLYNVPSVVSYGADFGVSVTIPNSSNPGDEIDFVALIRCASVTHHYDWDQRCIRLDIKDRHVGNLTVVGLPDDNPVSRGHYLAPPGYYMLFAVRKLQAGQPQVRVPSVAKFVQVR